MRATLRMAIVLALLLPAAALAQDQRCFPETGQCISGRIRQFWEQNGGLPVFGFPTGPQGEIQIEGQLFQAQTFERNRLELHPEKARPYDVLLGRLGVDRLQQQGRDWFGFPKNAEQPGCRFFGETGHNVCGEMLNAWRASGLEIDGKRGKTEAENLALWGLPISDLQTENIQGKDYQVQWFERARFELHPENPPPFNVLFGLLGNEIRDNAGPPPPPPQPTPTPGPKPLPPPSFNNCQADPTEAPNYPIQIVAINKVAETVTLKNVSPDPVNLDGWRMCSIKGNQLHEGIGGVLAPGEMREFGHPGGQIWNNSEEDDGALYNSEGQLVSFRDA